MPAYGIAEAAHYLRIPTATLRSWVHGRYYPTVAGDYGCQSGAIEEAVRCELAIAA